MKLLQADKDTLIEKLGKGESGWVLLKLSLEKNETQVLTCKANKFYIRKRLLHAVNYISLK